MKPLYKVIFNITDKGIIYFEQKRDIILKQNDTVQTALERELRKYRRALNLSTKFQIEIIDSRIIGYCK